MIPMRPGSALLVSPNPEELRGAPGPALAAALDAAATDPQHAPLHLVDAALAALAGGEPRYALDLLEGIGEAVDPAVARRVAVVTSWARLNDRNLYPGGTGAELADGALDEVSLIGGPQEGDAETMLLEALCAFGPPSMLTHRALVGSRTNPADPQRQQVTAAGLVQLQQLVDFAAGLEVPTVALWATMAQADLAFRAGQLDMAMAGLAQVRAGFAQLEDHVGVARTLLLEGDWYATPGSYPESLGLDLAVETGPSPFAGTADRTKAAQAYQQAAAVLAAASAPRADAALALRLAYLAGEEGRHDDQIDLIERAHAVSTEAGDAAAAHLATIQLLLARVAAGDGRVVRVEAGTGWDLQPVGPIAAIVEWATIRGSVTWATGLGRLCQRVAEGWTEAGRLDRAETAYALAMSLLPVSGAVPIAEPLVALAGLDHRRNHATRALVRVEQAMAHPVPWLRQSDVLMSLAAIQADRAGSSQMAQGIAGLARIIRLLDEHTAPGDDAAGAPGDADALFAQFQTAMSGQSPEQLLDPAFMEALTRQAESTAAAALQQQEAMMRWQLAINQARLRQRGGWQAQADALFQSAITEGYKGGPGMAWLAALTYVAWGRLEHARKALADARATARLPPGGLAALALRVGDYQLALEHIDTLGTSDWKDLADRAEILLETGDPEAAAGVMAQALAAFEATASALDRDPDLVAFCDDVSAGAMYLVAARIQLAIADERATAGDDEARRAALSASFDLGDRGRSLALLRLVSSTGDEAARRRQELAAQWAAGFDRAAAAIETPDADLGHLDLSGVDGLDRRLLVAEARAVAPPPLGAAPGLADRLCDSLPETTCVLQYHHLGRDLVVWAVTGDGIATSYRRLEQPVVEGLVNRLVQSASRGDPGEAADDLARLLIEPVADALRSHPRVVIVPYGALTAVPFSLLPLDGAPLVDTHTISYTPAAAMLDGVAVDGPIAGSGAAIVGNPAFDPGAHPGLRPLPGAAVEARAVHDRLGGDEPLIGPDADEASVRQRLQGRAVVHLAAHGRLDQVAPTTSSIVLGGSDELTVADLIGMQIDAGLVVLSACDTGRGAATLGGDLVGLTRGLIAAGAARSVVSLWPVDDVAACVTMAEFYAALDASPPAEALARAQRAVRAMTSAEIAARYVALGGDLATGSRRSRRGELVAPASRPLRSMPMLDEFRDVEEDEEPDDPDRPATASLWAPFVLVGP